MQAAGITPALEMMLMLTRRVRNTNRATYSNNPRPENDMETSRFGIVLVFLLKARKIFRDRIIRPAFCESAMLPDEIKLKFRVR